MDLLVQVIIAIIMALISTYVIPALKAYVEGHKNSQLFSIIETAVTAAEQTISGHGEGETKKKNVEEFVQKWAEKKGWTIDEDQLDKLIEECVYLLDQKTKGP